LRAHRECNRKGCRDSGAAAVEFALVLPLLLTIVLGTIDWGWYFFVREVATNAAREGARAGTLYTSGQTTQAHAVALAYVTTGALNAGKAVVTEGTGANSSVWVQVQYPVGSLTGFFTGVLPATVTARAEMR
jgi:Flp pilus assembly protein TadG